MGIIAGDHRMSVTTTLLMFNAYIQGGKSSSEVLKEYMSYYDKELEQLKTDFYATTIQADKEAQEEMEAILTSLNIPQSQWSGYSKLSVYDFFIRLKHENHYQADYILSLIEEKTSIATAKFVTRCLLSGAFSAGIALLPAMAGILGMISTSGFAASYLYDSQYDPKKTDDLRFRDDSFIVANAFFNLSAYAVWAAAELSFTVNSLFVAASVVNALKDLLCVAEDWLDDKKPPVYENNLSGYQDFLRHEYQYLQHSKEREINTAISISLAGVMAVWCFVPGGILLSVSAVASSIGLAIMKHCLLKDNEIAIRTALQTELDIVATESEFDVNAKQEGQGANRYRFYSPSTVEVLTYDDFDLLERSTSNENLFDDSLFRDSLSVY